MNETEEKTGLSTGEKVRIVITVALILVMGITVISFLSFLQSPDCYESSFNGTEDGGGGICGDMIPQAFGGALILAGLFFLATRGGDNGPQAEHQV